MNTYTASYIASYSYCLKTYHFQHCRYIVSLCSLLYNIVSQHMILINIYGSCENTYYK